jgi:futalosine hydrolase
MEAIAAVCSVDLEAQPLLRRLGGTKSRTVGFRKCHSRRLGDQKAFVLVGGMGKTNAAQALTALLEREKVSAVVGFGVGGAYLNAGPEVGEVAIASSEHYGDEGVETPNGWLSCEGIGIPLVVGERASYYNSFPIDPLIFDRLPDILRENSRPFRFGAFVTVSCCSGSAERGSSIAARFNAICESMEGAAYAHIATLYGIPYLEVRGISNRVTDRNLADWRLDEGAEAAAEVVERIIRAWSTLTASVG